MSDKLPRGVQELIRRARQSDILAVYELYRIYSQSDFGVEKDANTAGAYHEQLCELAKELPLNLTQLFLKDFRLFKELKIDFDHQLTVIIGNNGAGKTTILEAIAKCLSWVSARMLTATGKGSPIVEHDIRNDFDANGVPVQQSYAEVTSYFSLSVDKLDLDFDLTLAKAKEGFSGKVGSKVQYSETLGEMYRLLGENSLVPLPFFAFYSVGRTLKSSSSKSFPVAKMNSRFAGLSDGMTAGSNLDRFFSNYIVLHNLAEDSDNKSKYQAQLRLLNGLLENAVEGLSGFKVKRPAGHDAVYVNNGQTEVEVWQLSDGQKVLLALVGDIALRLLTLNSGIKEPIENSHGIVLIDEVELHLHPKWQRKVVKTLLNSFPKCQFVLTTHSPQIPGEIQANSLRVLSLDNASNVQVSIPPQAYGLTSSAVLQELMGAEDINVKVNENIEDIFNLIDKEKFSEARDKIARLKRLLGGSVPKLVEAESWLTMLED